MDLSPLQKTADTGKYKVSLLKENGWRYVTRSVQAGLYLTLVTFLYWNLTQDLSASPFGKVVASLFFGVGLFCIVVTKAELFTSNNMYMTISFLEKKTSVMDAVRLWTVCYLGNLVGAMIVAGMLFAAGIIDLLPSTHALFTGAEHKAHQTAQVIFFKGILANWVVCLAVWVGMHVKDDMARFAAIVSIVFIFLYLGFEHSIANLGTFSIALLGHGGITFAMAAHNLLWATTGNILGGGLLIGVLVWLAERAPGKNKD